MKNLKLIIAFVITFCFVGLFSLNAENSNPTAKNKSTITIEKVKSFKENKKLKKAKVDFLMWAVEKE